jgi:peptidoglycan/xylan/chitin deacetylase (PgdA/CDA1 family)
MAAPSPSWSYLSAQALHYAFFGIRGYEYRRRRATVGGDRWPAFGVPGHGVALTVDDGPHPQWTAKTLDLLARHGVHATFFLIGTQARTHPELARRIVAEGHTVGNHSMHHPQPFAALPPARLATEIGDAQREIEDAAGVTPRLFRAPGGNWSRRVLRAVADHHLTTVDWTVNPSDWRSPGVPRITRALARCRAGHILLCHDGGGDRSQTVEALDTVIPRLLARGLTFITPEARQ